MAQLVLSAALAFFAIPSFCQDSTPAVTVKNGSYVGFYQGAYNQDLFLGMPYAQPPVGDLRLRVPVPLNETWSGTRNATAYSPECVGYGSDDFGYESSEDCLTLNVIRPTGYENQSLPVAVWIHGGGYYEGGSADKRYNLTFIVENSVNLSKPIIAVSINYRLSGWGFLFSKEVREAGVTNLGIRDQRLALQWVQENIAAFGGDPTKVTIWGESAGAGSVGIHAIAYGGRDDKLFRGIIGESGTPLLLGFSSFPLSQAIYDDVVNGTGCSNSTDTLECLRSVSFETLNTALNVTPTYFIAPQPDGDIIQNSTYTQLLNGDFVKVPYLVGTNSDEGVSFAPTGINNDTAFEDYLISSGVPANDTTVLSTLEALYPDIPSLGVPATLTTRPTNTTIGVQLKRAAAYAGDYTFIAGRRLTTTQWSRYNVTSYAYRFNVIVNGYSLPVPNVGHFSEVSFVFNNVDGLGYTIDPFGGGNATTPPSYYKLSKLMSNAWVSFIHDQDPNGHGIEGVEEWPIYNDENGDGYGKDFVFDANVTGLGYVETDDFRGEAIAYLNENWGSVYGL